MSRERVIEPLNKLDRRALAASRRADECDIRARLDGQVEAAEHPHAGARRVAEVDVLEADLAARRGRLAALGALGVDLGHAVQAADDGRASTLRGRDVRHEGEHVAGLDGTEGRGLQECRVSDSPCGV